MPNMVFSFNMYTCKKRGNSTKLNDANIFCSRDSMRFCRNFGSHTLNEKNLPYYCCSTEFEYWIEYHRLIIETLRSFKHFNLTYHFVIFFLSIFMDKICKVKQKPFWDQSWKLWCNIYVYSDLCLMHVAQLASIWIQK